MTNIPTTMHAVILKSYDGKLESVTIGDVPVPRPSAGQVLVKVSASPINPSDLAFLAGQYGFTKTLPTIPGFEGSGTVISSGGGVMANLMKGRRVACATADPKIAGGLWAEYVVTSAQMCIPLAKHVTDEQGAMMLVNPMTAYAMVDEARRNQDKAIVQTAAASALGKMIIRLGKKFGLPVVNVVRRPEQVNVLHAMDAKHVLDSSTADFDSKLRDVCRSLNATIGLDAVAGELTGRVMRAQPKGSRMLVYGGLSLKACEIDPGSLIFEGKKLEGFWISAWLAKKNVLAKMRIARQVQSMLGDELKSGVQARVPLSDAVKAIQQYMANMTAGKVLLTP